VRLRRQRAAAPSPLSLTRPRRNGFRRGWLPWAKLQAAAKRCGLGTLDFRIVFSGPGAGAYVSKYLTKSVGDADGSARRYALSVSIPEIKEAGWSWSPARVALVAVEQLGAVEIDWDAVYWDGRERSAARFFAAVPETLKEDLVRGRAQDIQS
jgi:hypothetical protein